MESTFNDQYDHIQWEKLPAWVKDGVIRFPFQTTAEVQIFSDMMAARMGTTIQLAHTMHPVKDMPSFMETFLAETVGQFVVKLVVILMHQSWQVLDLQGNATFPIIESCTRTTIRQRLKFRQPISQMKLVSRPSLM